MNTERFMLTYEEIKRSYDFGYNSNPSGHTSEEADIRGKRAIAEAQVIKVLSMRKRGTGSMD